VTLGRYGWTATAGWLTAEEVSRRGQGVQGRAGGDAAVRAGRLAAVELDARTGFTGCFTSAGDRKQARSPDLTRNILAVLIGMATSLGLTRMAEACGIPYDVLRWTQESYVREETLR
jgi:hypothetical protein